MARGTNLYVDLDALEHNIRVVYQKNNKPLMTIIKANAYGVGAVGVAKALENMDEVTMYGVATLKEALELKRADIKKDIFILGAIGIEDIACVKANNIIIDLHQESFYEQLTQDMKYGLRVHIKVDTGMNRLGFKHVEQIEAICHEGLVSVEGIYTHYATSDDDLEFVQEQFNRFKSVVEAIDYDFKWIHASNSGASLYFHDDITNLVRPGIALYGEDQSQSAELKHVVSLKTVVQAIQTILPGESVGYGRTYIADKKELVAILPIGYADGLLRRNQGSNVWINGCLYEIVGRICMDQTMIRVDEHVQLKDEVEIFGPHISIIEVANRLDTITHEVLTTISSRVERKYIRNVE